jgi:TonB-linked SusC/RagA family outer membrane protein
MRIIFTFSVLLVLSTFVYSQQRTITGGVTSVDDGMPLPGVSVVVTGTAIGTITDVDGKFQLEVSNENATLSFSFIGMTSQIVALDGRTEFNIALVPTAFGVDEVVVTALGIEKQARSLTYSTQKVGGDDLTSVKNVNMINSLSGKSAGLVIGQSSSGVGGSSRVIIRGNKSISGENQPLYVIDGIPMNNSSLGQIGGSQLGGSVDGGDAISNINPDDIESINILKGAAASALYGSMGQNGVILISTKKGKSGVTKIELSTSTSFESALTLPELQSAYGATTVLDPLSTANDPSTWGSKNNGSISTDDLKDFFQRGLTTINSVSVMSGTEKNQFYLSYANTTAKGIIETNDLNKHNFLINGSSKYNEKLTFDGSANLISQTINNRPYVGFYSNPAGEAYLYGGSGSDFNSLSTKYQT